MCPKHTRQSLKIAIDRIQFAYPDMFLVHRPPKIDVRVVALVVVDSHFQRIVLATKETTMTQQVSHRPIKFQSRLWSQRGAKVNGSHHGDNPLLRPTGIQVATKRHATLQVMAPTNVKTVHQTSLLYIKSNLDRLGLLSPMLVEPHNFLSRFGSLLV